MTIELLVGAGKGGVGKSTVALNLAVALAARGRRIGLLDADLTGPNLPVMVGLTRYEPREQWSLAGARKQHLESIERFGLRLFSAGLLFGEDQNLRAFDMSDMFLRQLLTAVDFGEPEILVIDVPPGSGRIHQSLASLCGSPRALIVVTPQRVAHLDARKAVDMYRRLQVPILGGVENMTGLWPDGGHDRAIWSLGVDLLGRIPFEAEVGLDGDRGVPAVVARPDGETARAFDALAESVAAAL